jgi:cytochrome c oxidase subunit 2
MTSAMHVYRWRFAALGVWTLSLALLASRAVAQAPRPWEVTLQPAYSPVKQDIIDLNWFVLGIITLITLLVGALLGWVLFRYRASRNPVPSQVSHNTVLEIAWTTVPILVLVAIAIPSFRLLYYENRTRDPQLTLKVTAHQWYWEYEYPDQGGLDINSRMIPLDQLKPGQLRLLSVDHPLVLPVDKNIRILETSSDVIHSFFIPSLGVQRYAIPGQTIETWTKITAPGTYYGECNQICGTGHSEMPIEVRAVSWPEFLAWAKKTKAEQDNAENAAPAPAGAPARLAALRP